MKHGAYYHKSYKEINARINTSYSSFPLLRVNSDSIRTVIKKVKLFLIQKKNPNSSSFLSSFSDLKF